MKKSAILKIICLLALFTLLYGCSSSEESSSNNNTGTDFVTGKILMVNNEPFSKVALVTDKSVYLLDCPEDMRKALYQNQGRTAKVFYSGYIINDESVKVLKVEKVEISNKD